MNSNSVIEGRNNQGKVFDTTIELADNAMLRHRPDLFDQWDFEKNDLIGLDAYKVTKGSSKKAWWNCSAGHNYNLSAKLKSNGVGCAYCASRKLLVGFNDTATTNPNLHSLMLHQEDGYKYMQFSNLRVDWKCPNCNKHINNKKISDVNSYGLSCSDCSDGIKYPEKVMREVLNQLQVEYIRDEPLLWSQDRRYDFYLPKKNIIIETHGGQHYNGGFKTYDSGKNLEQEMQNDIYKKNLALTNNIREYIEIDCRNSEISHIKNSILESDLANIFNLHLINWVLVEKQAQKSVSYESLLLWNNGCRDILEIACKLKIHKEAVRRYLKQWGKLGKCDFGSFSKSKRKIVQLDENCLFIKEWESISSANLSFSGNKNNSLISKYMNGGFDTAYGFRWMYLDDYEKYLRTGKVSNPTVNRLQNATTREVVKLSMENKFITTYLSISLAASELEIKTTNHITSCCRGKRNSCGGFKWMYKEDYEMMTNENTLAM